MLRNDVSMSGTQEQRTKRAIDVLKKFSAAAGMRAPAITPSSTGVMLNHARALVRKAR